ncbi:hypothetical protein K435DRAFT_852210 [Dendrothele bispora CBS 962.96]|uniref:Endonuclease/exonuclease/phosphatase domain-containing protein n=1 Tax=Dendrothele bispora (strain CBS 962.96) TaxID=1314807 RepID=A0A4S8MLP6_DENBC|nr:hypothetical protein K435DRAFT_852210 [Dendrothele bispora CBS 962.96]
MAYLVMVEPIDLSAWRNLNEAAIAIMRLLRNVTRLSQQVRGRRGGPNSLVMSLKSETEALAFYHEWHAELPKGYESVSTLTAISSSNLPVLIMADLNARTGVMQTNSIDSRSSSDSTTCSRGSRLIKESKSTGFSIVNGYMKLGPTADRATSFHGSSTTVIDYALAGNLMCERIQSFSIDSYDKDTSDHVAINVTIELASQTNLLCHRNIKRPKMSNPLQTSPLPSETKLDCLYIETINSISKLKSDPVIQMFGFLPATPESSRSPLRIFTASVFHNGTASPKHLNKYIG